MITHESQLDYDPAGTPGPDAGDVGRAAARGEPSAAVAVLRAPLIGRDEELHQLLEQFYQLHEGGGARLVTVVGEAGIGKSRLASELRQWVARQPEPAQLFAFRADRQSGAEPYALVRQLVAALFRIHVDASAEAARAQIEAGVTALLGPGQGEKAHFIGQLAGYDFSASPHLRGVLSDPRQLRDRALHYAGQCLAALAARAPTILLIDDLHEADDSSLDAIAQVAAAAGRTPLLVICLAQGQLLERRPEWGAQVPGAAMLRLGPLSERDSRRLVAELLRKAGKLPAELRALVVGRAEGNPYYVEELIKMLIADGAIVPGPDTWQIQSGRLARLRIPGSLDELLRARLQALSAAEREFLLRAAVVGRTFWASAAMTLGELGQALGEPPAAPHPPVDALLDGLVRRELIVPQQTSRFPGEQEYQFRHELLHAVAYGQVPAEQRALYHRRAAEWLVERALPRRGADAGPIAEQFERAGMAEQAGRWHLRAGLYAAETYALDAALAHFRRALDCLPDTAATLSVRVICYEGLADAQLALARFADALAGYDRMRDLAELAGDTAAEARAWNGSAVVYDNQLEPRLAEVSASHALALAEQSGDQAQLQIALVRLAWSAFRLEQMPAALELGRRALELAERSGDQRGVARAMGLIGVAYETQGDFAQAARYLEEALQVNFALGDLSQASIHLNNLGFLANGRGDYAAALQFLEEGLRICAEIGSRVNEIYALSNLGTTLNGLGRHGEAEAASRRGILMCEASRIVPFSDFYRELAVACLGLGRVDEALEAAQRSVDLARRTGGPRDQGTAWRALGLVIGQLSDPLGASACFGESARLLTEAGVQSERARTLRAWADHELRRGDSTRGEQLWSEARAIFAAAGLSHELARTPEGPQPPA